MARPRSTRMMWVQSWGRVLLGELTSHLLARSSLGSVVTKGTEKATKRQIALKKLIMHNLRDGVRLQTWFLSCIDRLQVSVTTLREIKILKSLDHKNVVPILDMVVQPS
jgi:hypothetical protein